MTVPSSSSHARAELHPVGLQLLQGGHPGRRLRDGGHGADQYIIVYTDLRSIPDSFD
jgi:hypothetical protein